ncbi:MAG: hypothetical protein EXR28_06395 [Betaproteobacteria bacterium]|nr:hypothetical protein [Betaproteobacteria bacterium]
MDGGYLFTTRGAYCSGCNHSDWIYMGGMVEGAAPSDRRLFFVPRRDFTIDENWQVAGLKATGSHDVVTVDAFVPESCAVLAARLFKFAGSIALSNDLPFGRYLADITAGRQHITCNADAFGRSFGAALLGAGHKASDFL